MTEEPREEPESGKAEEKAADAPAGPAAVKPVPAPSVTKQASPAPVPAPKKPLLTRFRLIVLSSILIIIVLSYFMAFRFITCVYRHTDFADPLIEKAIKSLPTDYAGRELIAAHSELIHILSEKDLADSMPYFKEALQSDDAFLVNGATRGIYKLGPQAADAVPELIIALDHPHPFAKLGAVMAVGRIGGDAAPALPALYKTLAHPAMDIRLWTAHSIGLIGGRESVPALRQALYREPTKLCIAFIQRAILKLEGAPSRLVPGVDFQGNMEQ